MREPARILAVDDAPPNLRLLEAVLVPKGYEVVSVGSGVECLRAAAEGVDLVLLDVHLPDLSGLDVCQRLRADPATATLPIVMITATATASEERVAGLEAGADDFVAKPFNAAELLARVRSLLRVKRYHDELMTHRARLTEQIKAQGAEIDHLRELRRFLPEPVLDAIERDPSLLEPHRREVSVLFADLRGFTSFSDAAEPEEVLEVLHTYHSLVERHVRATAATVGYFAGDGVMLFWNDPDPCPDPAGVAVRTALHLVEDVTRLGSEWSRMGYELGVGIGVASGYATIGMMGFDGRWEYSALGPVVNLAARLSDVARDEHTVLVNQRTRALLDERLVARPLSDELDLPGFTHGVPVWHVDGVDELALVG